MDKAAPAPNRDEPQNNDGNSQSQPKANRVPLAMIPTQRRPGETREEAVERIAQEFERQMAEALRRAEGGQ